MDNGWADTGGSQESGKSSKSPSLTWVSAAQAHGPFLLLTQVTCIWDASITGSSLTLCTTRSILGTFQSSLWPQNEHWVFSKESFPHWRSVSARSCVIHQGAAWRTPGLHGSVQEGYMRTLMRHLSIPNMLNLKMYKGTTQRDGPWLLYSGV